MEHNVQGVVFDIKRFAIHDGPGIRTSVFLKGCPLSCLWCQNPEGISRDPILWYVHSKCIKCGDCVGVCPQKALTADAESSHYISINRNLCNNCGECVKVCPSTALSLVGKKMGVSEVVEELLKDIAFYESSGGGITLTGGEPLGQTEFSRAILGEMKARAIHTAVETCLPATRDELESLVAFVDLFLVDLKIYDSKEHVRYTKAPNEPIKKNFEWLIKNHDNVLVRIPIIPGYTDSEENLRLIGAYVTGVDPNIPIELVNFNPLARDKYAVLSKPYPLQRVESVIPNDKMNELRQLVADTGAVVRLENE